MPATVTPEEVMLRTFRVDRCGSVLVNLGHAVLSFPQLVNQDLAVVAKVEVWFRLAELYLLDSED